MRGRRIARVVDRGMANKGMADRGMADKGMADSKSGGLGEDGWRGWRIRLAYRETADKGW